MSNNSREEQKQILENKLKSSREQLEKLIGEAQSNKNEAEDRNDTDSAAYFNDLISQYARALQLTFEEQLKNETVIKNINEPTPMWTNLFFCFIFTSRLIYSFKIIGNHTVSC